MLNRIAPIILVAACLTAAERPPEPRRIVGGSEASVYDYPFVVLLVANSTPVRTCTATLVSSNWLLTAAHCVDGLRVGEYSWDSDLIAVHGYPVITETRHVVESVMHSEYDPLVDFREWQHDLALIRIDSPFLSRTAVPVAMAGTEDAIFHQSGVMATAVGWGGENASSMTEAEWPLAVCPDDAVIHLCTGADPNIHVEGGDSGGPLLILEAEEWKQIGVHSSIDLPAGAQTGVQRHVRVAAHREWIDAAIAGTLPETPVCSDPVVDDPPSPPPAPPPFQPQAVEVALGASGQSITLMTTEAGGFTLNGEAVSTGDTHAADNGNYTLTLAGGTWTAAFAPGSMDVALGASGQSITLTQLETGGYGSDGTAVESGATYVAANGNYTLTMEGGVWMATFAPAMREVALGASGDSVTIVQMEAGGWAIGGAAVASGGEYATANGTIYILTYANGTWSAALKP